MRLADVDINERCSMARIATLLQKPALATMVTLSPSPGRPQGKLDGIGAVAYTDAAMRDPAIGGKLRFEIRAFRTQEIPVRARSPASGEFIENWLALPDEIVQWPKPRLAPVSIDGRPGQHTATNLPTATALNKADRSAGPPLVATRQYPAFQARASGG